MAAEVGVPRNVVPVASVWCRQVDNEAESPGYTAIPDEFPGRRETLDTIRVVGNLTINVADTHDYWDPAPTQSLSFYPNLFLYPAAGGRYTCIGRMFLSTEDRPRLGMKTLVFSTSDLFDTGDFGGTVLRAQANMDGRAGVRRPTAPPDPSIYQLVGEGFLFHRGSTEPVVVVASDQWEAVSTAVLEILRAMPSSLVAMGAFLVFPYFLPAAKVDMHEFAEQLPLALAVMRVPRSEAAGERHEKRIANWASQPVTLRDLTKPTPAGKTRETLPLVLQYVRDDEEQKILEVARRVDMVEFPRVGGALSDAERQTGQEHRKEMWRIGTAMETAALLLSKPRGRTIPVSGETAKRANAYLEAKPGESPMLAPAVEPAPTPTVPAEPATSPAPSPPPPAPGAPSPGPALPAWLRPPATPALPPADAAPGVPVSTSDDPSMLHSTPPPTAAPPPPSTPPAPPRVAAAPSTVPPLRLWKWPAPSPAAIPAAEAIPPTTPPASPAPAVSSAPSVPAPPAAPAALLKPVGPLRPAVEAPAPPVTRPAPTPLDLYTVDERVARAIRDAESRWTQTLDARIQEASEASTRSALSTRTELASRIAAVEAAAAAAPSSAPVPPVPTVDQLGPALDEKIAEAVRVGSEGWAERFHRELKEATDRIAAQTATAEEELRGALVAQLDLEIVEAKEQGAALREEVESRVQEILKQHLDEVALRTAKETRDSELRLGLLLEGRAKDTEAKLTAAFAAQANPLAAAIDERVTDAERRLAVERDARLEEISEAQSTAVAGLQVRMQSFFEMRIREDQARAEEKYVELLARLKAELEQNVDRSLASPKFDVALRDRLARIVEARAADQRKAFADAVAEAEDRLRQEVAETTARLQGVEAKIEERGSDLARLEETVRGELDDLERRLMVVNDHVLPVVRQTWLKVSGADHAAQEKALEDRFVALQQQFNQELRRIDRDSQERAVDLRDRLEASVATHGRIWLSLLRQLSPGGDLPPSAVPSSHRQARRAARSGAIASRPPPPEGGLVDTREPYAVTPPTDPPNPMDPELANPSDPAGRDVRRRPRRS